MGPNGVLEQLSKGAVGALDEVSLTGGPWRPLFQHADFRPYFFPGEEQLTQSKAERKKERGQWFWYDLRQHSKRAWAVGAAGASLSLAVVSAENDFMVIPEEWIDTVDGWLSSVKESVQGEPEVAQKGAAGDAPAQALILELAAKHPAVGETEHRFVYLQQGRAKAWESSDESLGEAKGLFEQAVVASPDDPEALASLAEAYAKQAHLDAAMLERSEQLLERAAYFSSDTVSSATFQRARGWWLLMSGDPQGALDSASQCGVPVANAGLGNVDLGCALLVSYLDARLPGMTELGQRFPDVLSVQVVWAQAALDRDELGQAEEIGLHIHRNWPESPWVRQLAWNIALRLGRWQDALMLIDSVPAPGATVDDRSTAAEIILKAHSDPAAGHEAYVALLESADVDTKVLPARVWADAATAAYFNGPRMGWLGT